MLFRKKRKLEDKKLECIKNMLKLTTTVTYGTIRSLFNIKDVELLKESEQKKNDIRNTFIENTIKNLLTYSDQIKELSKTAKSIR